MFSKKKLFYILTILVGLSLFASATYVAQAFTAKLVVEDPLVRMPGTQPNQAALESPTRCLNCHAGYNSSVEPGFNWQGSMMAQAARDFLFWSCMTVSAQDSIWAVGTPNATDICERCHFPKGWLEGRSDPTNASLMTGADYDGVQCDFCHRMYDPHFETTFDGSREGSDWVNYWDEATNFSQDMAAATRQEDSLISAAIGLFNGGTFFTNNLPPSNYQEAGSGQFFISPNRDKRASFADANAKHAMFYSRFHKSKYFCASCHDVSNPILANLPFKDTTPGDGSTILLSELNSAYSYFHVERTFSEFMLSDYGLQGGAFGMGPFDPSLYMTSDPDNKIRMCQDCHMRDTEGAAANKAGTPVRTGDPATTGSTEHPYSGQPIHDLTGGNAWVSWVLASAVPGSPNHDPTNDDLLNQGAAALTLDLNQGEGINPNALLAGVGRAKEQLQLAASIQNVDYNPSNGALSFRVQNQTGHKLISGFPEGRRMFVNIQAKAGGTLIYEVNPYDPDAGTLKGLTYPYIDNGLPVLPDPLAIGANEIHLDELVYEMKPTSSLTGEDKTFHFALATGRYKDNRIPPKGFRINEAAARISVPVWHAVDTPSLYTSAEYAGGYDDVSIHIAPGADEVVVNLYYQTTSREYIEFLRDEITGTGNQTLTGTGPGGDPPYIIQSDPFFNQLKAWGGTLWQLWTHNMNVDGAKPFLMTSATFGVAPPPCEVGAPTLDSAVPASNQVTLNWTAPTSVAVPTGYNVYYDQSGKSQLVADAGLVTSYTDTGLTNDTQYCYKVSAYNATCESVFSNIRCATPTGPGQQLFIGAGNLETGRWVTTGKGKTQTTVFELTTLFAAGDGVVIHATVRDGAGNPMDGAVVEFTIIGPESVTLTSGPSDAAGLAEATWQTKSGNRKNPGTTPGQYTVRITNVGLIGYTWDGVFSSVTFNIQ
jgi:cytochrome c553